MNITFQSKKIFAMMNPLTSNVQKTAFARQPLPFTLVEMMDFVKKLRAQV